MPTPNIYIYIYTHMCWFLWLTGTLYRRNGFYTVQSVFSITLHNPTLKLIPHRKFRAILLSQKKKKSVWFISLLNYGDTENVLINHLLLVIPMSYPCHYTNLCPHKPHKHCTHTYKYDIFESHCIIHSLLLPIGKKIAYWKNCVKNKCITS